MDEQKPADTPPMKPLGLTFADIMRDTGLDRSQVRALLAHLDIFWTFDGHSNRVPREDYEAVRHHLKAIIPRLEARDAEMSKHAPRRRRPKASR